jgi:acetyl-CoA acetyltransferase
MRDAVIVSSVRTPVGKAFKGTLRATRPDELAAAAIKEAVARAKGLDSKEIKDVILGCAMPETEQGMNVARAASLRAGLPVDTSAMTIDRFCSSGLHAIAIALGQPLGCTGAKLTVTILRELERRKARYGMVTMCVVGGMGAAGIFERAT